MPKNFLTILKSLQDKGFASHSLIRGLALKRKKLAFTLVQETIFLLMSNILFLLDEKKSPVERNGFSPKAFKVLSSKEHSFFKSLHLIKEFIYKVKNSTNVLSGSLSQPAECGLKDNIPKYNELSEKIHDVSDLFYFDGEDVDNEKLRLVLQEISQKYSGIHLNEV